MNCKYCSRPLLTETLCQQHYELGILASNLLDMGIVPTIETVSGFLNFLQNKPDSPLTLTTAELPELMQRYEVITL
jgi:hypothetical protein